VFFLWFCEFLFFHFPPNPFCLHFFVASCELSTSFVWVSKVLSWIVHICHLMRRWSQHL
jgi:hypothetical protein